MTDDTKKAAALTAAISMLGLSLGVSGPADAQYAPARPSGQGNQGVLIGLNQPSSGQYKSEQWKSEQLKSEQLRSCIERPLPLHQLVGASCHDAAELALAAALSADFAALSPVMPTTSHPDALALGWERFEVLAEAASLPVFALGGVSPADLDRARRCGGQGVAGIRGFW